MFPRTLEPRISWLTMVVQVAFAGLNQGLESGPAKKMTQKDWGNLRSRVRAHAGKKQF
jgi:hypothetical protein